MSRCFPFPPPGYVLNGIRDEAMIVSIKGAEEKAKKEQRRKDKKRDKKEKKDKKDKKERKEKKEKKRKDRDGKEGDSEKHSHKRRRKEEGARVDLFPKLKENEINCLDKSSLTVERELLQSTSQNSCDSTLNSNEVVPKHKKKQPLDGRHNSNDSESIIRIRLPIRRQKDPEVMTSNKDQETPCPSRGVKLDSSQLATREPPVNQHPKGVKLDSSQLATREPPVNQHPKGVKLDSSHLATREPPVNQHPKGVKLDSSQLSTREPPVNQHFKGVKLDSSQLATREPPVNQHPCSTSAPEHASKLREEKRKDTVSRGKHHGKGKISSAHTPKPYQPTKSRCSCPPSVVLQFLNVVENWVPPNTIERRVDLINSEDEECWWSMKKPSSPTERCIQLNRNNETTQVGNSMGWPCARLLPEADVYALPYTVPF